MVERIVLFDSNTKKTDKRLSVFFIIIIVIYQTKMVTSYVRLSEVEVFNSTDLACGTSTSLSLTLHAYIVRSV
ncbi:hypothetical protein FlaCF_1591 [Flavobacterium tructae]